VRTLNPKSSVCAGSLVKEKREKLRDITCTYLRDGKIRYFELNCADYGMDG
jgi:hypothetical protein